MLSFPMPVLEPPVGARKLARVPLRRLLLVEDDPYYQQVVTRVFQRLCPEVVIRVCTGHDEASTELFRARWTDKPYDAMVLDHFLPDGYGLDLWRTCMNMPGLGDRIVMMSGLTESEFFHWCDLNTREEAPHYVSKISTPREIARKLYDVAKRMGMTE